MKKQFLTIFSIAVILFAGCGTLPVPEVPAIDLYGTIDIRIMGGKDEFKYEDYSGMFKVNGEEKIFAIYLSDEYDVPRGKIIVEKGEVKVTDFVLRDSVKKALIYWPYIFGWGEEIENVELEYTKWADTSHGKFPEEVNMKTSKVTIYLKLRYGD
ncbi:hypothetical protein ACFLUV_01495 [Elusimicrobiota bacterium]